MKAYGLSRGHLSPYAARRVWRVLDTAAPSLGLPADTNVWMDDYPFSVEAETPLKVGLCRARRPNGSRGDVALCFDHLRISLASLGSNRSNQQQRDRRRSRRRRIRLPTSPRSTATTTRARRTT